VNWYALLAFGGCQLGMSSRQRRAGQAQKESSQAPCQSLALRSMCAMLFPRESYHWADDIAAANTLTA